MNKTIIVSNRLPVALEVDGSELSIKSSVGGLATGMKSIHSNNNGIWIGWSGLTDEQLNSKIALKVDQALENVNCISVPLNDKDIKNFYYGFTNKALWPLFHYFLEYTEYELEQWNSYKEVNAKFAKVILDYANDGDTIWIHDYQLMLLPQLLREQNPNLTIGFFLHIPYPSYEIFRTFPWREKLLQGLLGADLIGFHTYDYVSHFLGSVSRISGLEVKFNEIFFEGRIIKVDSFPMGIDYDRYHDTAVEHQKRPEKEISEIILKLREYNADSHSKLILSIDRMDYTKGIPNRIRAFEYFLNKYPQFHEKVRLVMLTVPSRENVPQYQKLKRETDEMVGRINGQFATVNWTPIWYFYRSMPFEDLIDLYTYSDIALITPIRDGMNLVSKEYTATQIYGKGVLILSEMAGAAKEMYEALIVNPNNFDQIADTIKQAIEMPEEEQKLRMQALQNRVARYNVEKWADDFMKSLAATKHNSEILVSKKLTETLRLEMYSEFQKAKKRLFLFDYDGTLSGFKNTPMEASPDAELYALLDSILENENTEVAIVSGRDRQTMEMWFGHKKYTLVTDHGVWLRKTGCDWLQLESMKTEWKENIRPVMETFVDRTPGAFIEEKEYSLAWHYRKSDNDLAAVRAMELKLLLTNLISNNSLSVLEGNKVLEIKSSNVNKGRATSRILAESSYDFIFAIGDDWTDEYMFSELKENDFTIKVGTQKTNARYFISSISEVRPLLEGFAIKFHN